MRTAKRVITGAAVAASLWMPSTAAGRSAASNGYEPPGGTVQQQVESHHQGQLPFTGMDISLAGAAGILLVGMGVAIRRLGRPEAN